MEDSILSETVEYLNEGGYTPLITDNKSELLNMISKTGYKYDELEWDQLSKGNILSSFLEGENIPINYKVKFIGIILPKIKARSKLNNLEYEWIENFYNELYKWYREKNISIVSLSNPENKTNIKIHGEGSYALVYSFKDKEYNVKVIEKKAKANLNEKEKTRFANEFKVLKSLSSPYIVEAYKFNSNELSYTMEYLDYTLSDYIKKYNNQLNVERRKKLCLQFINAFKYIHSKSYLHRDISPKNVLVKIYDDTVILKIADFGLVKDPKLELTSQGTNVKGYYNDPYLYEIGFDKYELSHEIYAMTKVVLFILTGRENINTIKDEKYKEFLKKGMNKDKSLRYRNSKEFLEGFKLIFK